MQCRHIYFGGPARNAYAELLQPYISDREFQDRITLLEEPAGYPYAQEMAVIKTKFKLLSLPGLFQRRGLPNVAPMVASTLHQDMVVLRNSQGQRIDGPLRYSCADYDGIKHLSLCYTYHLLGKCRFGGDARRSCEFDHGRKLTPEETEALRTACRRYPCQKGS